MLREFLAQHILDTVETDETPNQSNLDMPQVRKQVVVHKRRELNETWVSISVLKQWCGAKGIPYEGAITDLIKQGIVLKNDVRKYLGFGTKYQSGFTRCLVLDTAKL